MATRSVNRPSSYKPIRRPMLRAAWGAPDVQSWSKVKQTGKLRVRVVVPKEYTGERLARELATKKLEFLLKPSVFDGKSSQWQLHLDVAELKDVVQIDPEKVGSTPPLEEFTPKHYSRLYGEFNLFDVYCTLSEKQPTIIEEVLGNRNGNALFNLHLDRITPNKARTEISKRCKSLVIEDKEGKEVNVVHFSDPHVAARNDELGDLVDSELQDLRPHFKNFNQRLRFLVDQLNGLYREGKIDFAIGTGDLLDYAYKESIPLWRYTLTKWGILKPRWQDTNWEVFDDIMKKAEFPVFLTPGNHDYRRPAYHFLVMYKAFGLKNLGQAFRLVAKHIATKGFIRKHLMRIPVLRSIINMFRGIWYGVNALSKGEDSVHHYHLEMNPDKHYKRTYAGRTYLFLDTGPDYIPRFLRPKWWLSLLPRLFKFGARASREIRASFARDMDSSRDLIGGHPDSEGYKPDVIEWTQQVLSEEQEAGRPLPIIAQHTPSINTRSKIDPKDLTPEAREEAGKPVDLATDKKLDLDHGTFVLGRDDMLGLYPSQVIRGIAGHAHRGVFPEDGNPEAGYQFRLSHTSVDGKNPRLNITHGDFTQPTTMETTGIVEQVQPTGPVGLGWAPGFHIYQIAPDKQLTGQTFARLHELNPKIDA